MSLLGFIAWLRHRGGIIVQPAEVKQCYCGDVACKGWRIARDA